MPLTAIRFPGFSGGLNLRDQPDVVDPSQAIDLLNVTFTERGAVKQRDGYSLLTAAAGTNRYDSMIPYYTSGGTKQLVVGAGNRLEGISTAGAVVASSTAPTASPHFFARFGGPTTEVVYAANGTDQLRQWNAAAWSTPAWTGTAPTGKFVAVTPWDNRLVNARRSGATAGDNPSTVRFSDAGTPTTWGANNYIDVTPGDGEQIMGLAVWGDRLFVFKESRFFVFYGTSVDGSGNPTFLYEPVDGVVGPSASKAICVARDGVYFLNQRGIYRTTGSTPEPVSPLLDPLFFGGTSDFYLSGTLNQAALDQVAMAWHREQIYVAIPTGTSTTNNRVLVFDTRYGWWSMYDLAASALAAFKVGSQQELVFALAAGTKDIARHSSSYTTDNGTAVSSRWVSGWFDLNETVVKSVREAKVWGKGTVIVGVGHDYTTTSGGALLNFSTGLDLWAGGTGTDTWGGGTSLTDTWAAGRSLVPKLARGIAVRGTTFNINLQSSGGATWAVYRLATHVRGKRSPSVLRTEA